MLIYNLEKDADRTKIKFLYELIIRAKYLPLYSNSLYLMFNHICNSLFGFVFWNIMSRSFLSAEVGIGSSLVAASGLLSTLANMGLGIGLIRFVPEAREKSRYLINTVFTLASLVALAAAVIYLLFIGKISPELSFIRESIWLLILFAVFTVTTCLSTLTDSSLVAGRATRYIFVKNIIISMIKLPMPIFVFSIMGGFGIFCGIGTSILFGTLLSWLLFLPKVYSGFKPQVIFKKQITQRVLPYSFANYVGTLFMSAPQYIFPLMVLNVLGPEKSAYLWVAWMMTMVLAIIPGGLAQALLAEGSHNQYALGINGRRALSFSLVLSIPAVCAMFLLGEYFLGFFGPNYAKYGTVVAHFLAFAIIPQGINIIYLTINQVKKRVDLIVIQTGVQAFLALGVGWCLLKRIGLPGVGIGYLLAHTVVAIIVLLPLWREIRNVSIN